MKKIILFTITTLLLLFNCNDYNSGTNVPNEPPIPCEDGVCLLEKQLNFFKEYLEDDTLTKQQLFNIKTMSLSSQSISTLPIGIFDNLTNLTRVDLTDNPICSVDKSDVGLTDRVNLTFDVWGCLTDEQVTFFNRHIMSITTKKELYEAPTLNLSSKSITSLDTGIFNNLINVTRVDLTDNDICIVDKADVGLANVVNLTFDVWGCLTDEQLTFFSTLLPSSITTKKQLYEATSLDLQSKSITSLDTGIFNNLINVTSVDLTDNTICVDKSNVGLADSVTLTFDSWNCLTDEQVTFFNDNTPLDITTKQQLFEATTLDLQSRSITSLDTGIFNNLTNLTYLRLSYNDLSSIPTGIFNNLTSLTELWLFNNDLESIPAEIGNLTSLTELYLYKNNLTSIPTEIGNLTSLTTLSLHNNNLTSIPTEIGNLTSLRDLRLYDNELASIPNMLFTNLTSLTNLQLKNRSTNTFDCNDTNYTAWGLDTTFLPTTFRCYN